MPKILMKATADVFALVQDVLAEEYPPIARLSPGLTIEILFALSDTAAPALAKNGYPCAGIIKVVSEEARAAGGPDILLLLDGDRWPSWTEEERYSLIHHELHHLVPVKLRVDPDNRDAFTCDLDGLGRPKVRLRRHDFEVGGFNVIVERYGESCFEWQLIKRVHDAFDQQLLPFAKGVAS
ncbi:MAG: putative metallopeptidase [Isosphaeraceae bacterium]